MKTIKSKILVSILTVVLLGSTLIGVITALLNANGIDILMEKTLGPATQMAANAVEWRMDNYWTALQEAAASDIFIQSAPDAPELVPIRDEIAARNGFLYTGKMDATGFSSTGFSYADEEYFQQCKSSMQPYISDIMSDGNQMIFLLEIPIVVNGSFEGIVYGGISADFLTDIVVNLAMGDDGVAYVLDQRGNVIGHREKTVVEEGSNMIEAVKSDPSVADVAAVNQRMIQGETGFGRYQFYGDNKFVGFAPIGGNQNWSIAIEASQREFKSTLDQSIFLTLLVVIAVVVASIPIAVVIARSISRPIRACITRLEQLADGDIHTPAPGIRTSGEPEALTKALETTVVKLAKVVQDVSYHLDKMAKGDFQEAITETYEGDFNLIEESMKGINSSLNNILSQISQSVDTVAASSGQMADGAQSLSQGATQQASAIQELSATVTTISESSKQTAVAAEEVNHFVNQMGGQLAVSMDHVQDLNSAMEKISDSSEKIGKIIETIENIAFQTNILALNASVEAARAGTAGKGFAVVADEVRELANKSDDAAKAVKGLIEESIAVVAEGSRAVNTVTDSLKKTNDSAGNVTVKMGTVVEAVAGQTSDIDQINLGIDQISEVVQTTSATSEESTAISQELASQSQRLKLLSDQFTLK